MTKEMQMKDARMPEFVRKGNSRGSENVGVDDILIPRIGIIQDLSPERKKNQPEYINGAEEGMMFNSVTRELYKKELIAVPIMFRKEYILWRPRTEGGGFRGAFQSVAEAERAQYDTNETTEIVDTSQQFCLVSADGKFWQEAVLSMAKSNNSVSRSWNSDIRLRCSDSSGIMVYDRFALKYKVSVVEKTNDKGTFFTFKTELM